MIEQTLRDIGLTDSEIKVYLILLELEPSTTGIIIKKTGLQSSTVYHSLDLLIRHGLVSYVIRENKKYYQASEPDILIDFIKDKEDKLRDQSKNIKNIIPLLYKKRKIPTDKTEAKIYEGYKGIKAAFDDILRTLEKGEEYYVFGARGGLPLTWTRDFFIQFNKKKLKKGIKTKIIFNEDVRETTGADEEKLPLTKVRYLPQVTRSAANIYKDKVIIALWIKNPIAFMIKNKENADSYREYFHLLWKQAKN